MLLINIVITMVAKFEDHIIVTFSNNNLLKVHSVRKRILIEKFLSKKNDRKKTPF